MNSSGSVLDASTLIGQAGVQHGESLTLQIKEVLTQASGEAFVSVLGDGDVVSWDLLTVVVTRVLFKII